MARTMLKPSQPLNVCDSRFFGLWGSIFFTSWFQVKKKLPRPKKRMRVEGLTWLQHGDRG
jgi:hypothetical protein